MTTGMDDDALATTHAAPGTRRLTGIIALLVAIALAIGLAGAWPAATPLTPPPPPPAGFPIDYWDWGVNRTLSTAERQALDLLGGSEIFSLCGMIQPWRDEWLWEPQGRPSAPIPGRRQHLVVRIDSAIAKQMDPAIAARLIPLVVDGWTRNRTAATIGIQIDCDVPTRRIGAYAEVLRSLRAALPEGTHLSVTMLLDWAYSRDLPLLMETVDAVVPQFYNAYLPIDLSGQTPLVGGNDLERVVKKMEAIGRPYRIGLATYEQCSIYDSSGTLVRPAIPLSPEQVLNAGGIVERGLRGEENVLIVRMPKATKIGNHQLNAGQVLAFACNTPTGLSKRFADLRRLAPRHCAGVVLFRLPGNEVTHSLSLAQIAAAATANVRPAKVIARLEPLGNQHHALIVSNQGDEDFLDFTNPARVLIQVPGAEITAHRLPDFGSISAREVTSNNGQREALDLYIGLLRAGEVLTIEDLLISTPDGRTPRIDGVVQQGGQSRPLGR
ncbi:MAG: DUF3142 domain-containing protein [Planctomycetes bacterium]|nr:DUF3142 domain-containing protein [Planctomycetota bacterium]